MDNCSGRVGLDPLTRIFRPWYGLGQEQVDRSTCHGPARGEGSPSGSRAAARVCRGPSNSVYARQMLVARRLWVQYEWTKMIRKQLTLGLLAALLLVGTASAQTQQGEGDTSSGGGSGSGNVQSGSGQVATPPASTPRPRPAAPRPTATPFRAAPTPAPTVSQPRVAPSVPARRPAPTKPKPRKPKSQAGLAGGISTMEARCLSPLERSVLRRRANGASVTAIAAELDMAKGVVSSAEQSGLRRLVVRSGSRRCATDPGEGMSDTKARSRKRRVSAVIVPAKPRAGSERPSVERGATTAPAAGGQPVATFVTKKTSRGPLILLLVGMLVILGLGTAVHLWKPALVAMQRERSIRRDPFKRR
jgi:hypothetical protein